MPLDFPLLSAPRRAPPWYELGPIAGTTPSLLVRSGVRRGARGFRRSVSVVMVRPEIARNRDACGRGGFAEAAELFARLEHRAILPVEDIVEMEGGPSLVTAPLAGMTLARVLSLAQGRGRSVSLRVAARLVVELADAVEVLRSAMPVGSALGALSAHSAWVTSEGRALLLPSARCASLEGGLAVPGRGMADRYRAPELELGYSDSRADVYALALMLWDLLAPGIAGARVETAERTRVMATSVPDAVVELVLRCLSESPGDRLRDAGAFATALSALVAGSRDGSSETQREASTVEVEAEELEPTGALQVRILRGGTRREVELAGPVGRWTAGRAPAADLALADPEVSREHLEIALEPGGRVRIRDLGSKNGVFVNEARTRDRIVQPEDSVRLGTTVLRLRAGRRQLALCWNGSDGLTGASGGKSPAADGSNVRETGLDGRRVVP